VTTDNFLTPRRQRPGVKDQYRNSLWRFMLFFIWNSFKRSKRNAWL